VSRLRQLLLIGLLAGIAAGALATAIQVPTVTPLIVAAEAFEPGHAQGDHAHSGFERGAHTLLANTLAGIGFGLLLAAGLNLRNRAGLRAGLAWGLAGFAAFYLAPALGLPPSLPGGALAELGARQAWWLGTALASAGGLALLCLSRSAWLRVAGAVLLVLPHLVGAPHPQVAVAGPPPQLARAFLLWSAVCAAVFWLVLGAVSGVLFARFAGRR
jgi:cobalt transporter subunit CbtA